jgi:hypothetical protein
MKFAESGIARDSSYAKAIGKIAGLPGEANVQAHRVDRLTEKQKKQQTKFLTPQA